MGGGRDKHIGHEVGRILTGYGGGMRQRIGEEKRDKETRNEGSKETKRQDMRGGRD